MGENHIQATTEGIEDDSEVRQAHIYKEMVPTEIELTALLSTQIHSRLPRNHSYGGVSRLREDQDRCISRGDSGYCGEAEVDDKAWRKGIAAGQETHELPHDVQGK